MKKHYVVYHLYLVSFVCLLFISCSSPKVSYNEIKVAAPFPMEPIKECIFPEKDYSIADYGAIEGGKHINTEAISKAIEACNKAGGGRVVIPADRSHTFQKQCKPPSGKRCSSPLHG